MMETINIVAICILGTQLLLVFAILYLIDKSKTKKIQKEYLDLKERFIKIQIYLLKTHNLTYRKVESLIRQENYRKNNVIDITNYLKPKK